MDWLKVNTLDYLNFHPYSPDLNPTENLWNLLTKKFKNFHTTKKYIYNFFETLDESTLQNLVNSMPCRVENVINQKGHVTKY